MGPPARLFLPSHRIGWGGAAGLLVAAWLLPFLVHLMPWAGPRPAGVSLLPAFWTAFVAVNFCDLGLAFLVALAMPAVSLCVTGLPAAQWLGSMSVELVGYVLAASWLVRRWPRFWLSAPLAYLPAKLLAIAVGLAVPALRDGRSPWAHLVDAVSNGFPGLMVLLLINLALVRLDDDATDWDGD